MMAVTVGISCNGTLRTTYKNEYKKHIADVGEPDTKIKFEILFNSFQAKYVRSPDAREHQIAHIKEWKKPPEMEVGKFFDIIYKCLSVVDQLALRKSVKLDN